MIYSVWNQGKKAYDYYATKEVNGRVNTPAPRHIPSRTFGATVSQAAWPLPMGAKLIGSGKVAKGRIAARKGLGAADTAGGSVGWWIIMVAVGIAAVYSARK